MLAGLQVARWRHAGRWRLVELHDRRYAEPAMCTAAKKFDILLVFILKLRGSCWVVVGISKEKSIFF